MRANRPTIALALSGGAARAIAHLGVLEVLDAAGIPIRAIAGTSGGSLVGALYASGKFSIDELIQLVLKLRWWDFVRPSRSKQGFLDSRMIGRFLQKMMGTASFSDLAIPFAAVACDLQTGKKIVYREGPLIPAIQASCSLPVVFTPTIIGNRSVVDGGYVSQIPVQAARDLAHSNLVVGVDVNYRASEGLESPNNVFKIAIHLASLWARRNADEESKLADRMIPVDMRGIGLWHLHKSRELINRGRRASMAFLKDLEG